MRDLTAFSKNFLKLEKDSLELIKLPSWNISTRCNRIFLNTFDAVDNKSYYTPDV